MPHFRHTELVKRYQVSLKTIHNWIDAARQGKIDLQLHESASRTYIVNSPDNTFILERLAKQGRKYRNTRHHKTAKPTPRFYELYSTKQIYDIISNLKVHHEIPRQYNYFDGGADHWDRFAQRLWNEEGDNLLKGTVELLRANFSSLDSLIGNRTQVNVIDIGPGNALPVKELLEHLLERGILHRYIAIDISESMLDIAKNNIQKWFGEKVKFEGYTRDITHERFDDLIVHDMLSKKADDTINLALFLGATPMNFCQPYDSLKVIYGSLGAGDLLIYTDKPDTIEDRHYFNFNPQPGVINKLSPNHRLIFDLLNIDESLYSVEMGFNSHRRIRYIQVRLKTALTVKFRFDEGERSVSFNKGDTILLWRAWHQTPYELIAEFDKAGLALLQASLTKDRRYLLTISGVIAQHNADD